MGSILWNIPSQWFIDVCITHCNVKTTQWWQHFLFALLRCSSRFFSLRLREFTPSAQHLRTSLCNTLSLALFYELFCVPQQLKSTIPKQNGELPGHRLKSLLGSSITTHVFHFSSNIYLINTHMHER